MKASDLFVRCLEAEGVERIFGVPGEENADVMIRCSTAASSSSCAATNRPRPSPPTPMED